MADNEQSMRALDAAHEIFAQHENHHVGRIVDTPGDSVLALVETVSGAADAAFGLQDQLAAQVPQAKGLRFRIGVHIGDILGKTDGSAYGNGVNIAARLQAIIALAHSPLSLLTNAAPVSNSS